MEEKEEKKGFTIRDRRVAAQQERPEEKVETREKKGEREDATRPLPEIDFSSFIFSLSTSALLHLGEVPDPTTQKREKNLPLAKQTIDILGMLKEKTKGNLTPDEEKLLENILTDLRWRYVREVKD
ncbi:MAG: DUF1844 domain-containing protein [Thermodesulfobacteriota bacterium]